MNTSKATMNQEQIEACNVLIDMLIDDKETAEIFQSSQLREQALEILNSIRSRIAD